MAVAAVSSFSPNQELNPYRLASSSFRHFLSSPGISFPRRKFRFEPVRCSASSDTKKSFDVVIIGAGIIGLSIARQFLIGSDLSVAVVDKAVPCSGATGAGQGYIWMTHKTPGSETWDLALRSHKLWEILAENIRDEGMNPKEVLGWKKTGSLLVGRTAEECDVLKKRVNQLSQAGLTAEYLSGTDLLSEEPAMMVGNESGAAFLPDDSQLDAHLTVSYIEKVNRHFALEGRYAEFYHDPVIGLVRSGQSGRVDAVKTSNNTLHSKKATIVAAGSWSGLLMHDLSKDSDVVLSVPVKPRKGHLLVVENFNPFQLNHGLMEVGYADHQVVSERGSDFSPREVDGDQILSISMTATMDIMGNLVLGSSRQFCGFNTEKDETIINRIWERAGDFFPALKKLNFQSLSRSRKVRVGLRPYMPDGKPLIGPVPGSPNLFLATGHEGGGLSMVI